MKDLMILNGANPVHVAFAHSVSSDTFEIINRVTKNQFVLSKFFSLLKNSFSIPNYNTAICESCYYFPAIKKKFLKTNQKIINLNCGPLLYNLLTNRIKGLEKKFLLSLLNEVNGHLVFGKYGTEIIKEIDPNKPSLEVYPFVSDERMEKMQKIIPNLKSKEITIIGNDDIYCKGIDLLILAFEKVLEYDKNIKLNIVGNIKNLADFKGSIPNITIHGTLPNIEPVLQKTSLYVHPSRGDTFPRSSLEAMLAGIPNLVSVDTGTKEIVDKIDANMISKLEISDLSKKIISFFEGTERDKILLSNQFRSAALPFSKTNQISNFKAQFEKLKKLI